METAVAEVVATLDGKRSREQIHTYPAPCYGSKEKTMGLMMLIEFFEAA